mmetsp:Transcript_40676/g.42449  ORF Transcript_40676/g.42449 Transcript_40676/m.42449 type:complete len:218 (+) Transcript_40676:199-852(+)
MQTLLSILNCLTLQSKEPVRREVELRRAIQEIPEKCQFLSHNKSNVVRSCLNIILSFPPLRTCSSEKDVTVLIGLLVMLILISFIVLKSQNSTPLFEAMTSSWFTSMSKELTAFICFKVTVLFFDFEDFSVGGCLVVRGDSINSISFIVFSPVPSSSRIIELLCELILLLLRLSGFTETTCSIFRDILKEEDTGIICTDQILIWSSFEEVRKRKILG